MSPASFCVAGNGASHMGNFGAAAFVGATAAAMLASAAPWRRLGWLGVGIAAFRLISALIELASSSHWSDVVSIAGFLAFLAWVFAASVMLVVAMRRGATLLPQAAGVTSTASSPSAYEPHRDGESPSSLPHRGDIDPHRSAGRRR